MSIEIREEPLDRLGEHARIPIAFEVGSVLDVVLRDRGLGGVALEERGVPRPWLKDYDADERPAQWAKRWNIQNWGLVSAWDHATRIGGAVIAFDTPGVSMLEGRRDLVVLWDIRVAPAWRRSGVGSMLFDAATSWARARGCSRLDVETQNINVPACRFYARMGCTLRRVDRFAYADLPDEVQLLWSRQLT